MYILLKYNYSIFKNQDEKPLFVNERRALPLRRRLNEGAR